MNKIISERNCEITITINKANINKKRLFITKLIEIKRTTRLVTLNAVKSKKSVIKAQRFCFVFKNTKNAGETKKPNK